MNTDNIRKVADHIDKLPQDEFSMNWSCQCIGGHAGKMFGREPDEDSSTLIARVFELNIGAAHRIFMPGFDGGETDPEQREHFWPEQYRLGVATAFEISNHQAATFLRAIADGKVVYHPGQDAWIDWVCP